jgi:hypothetical protein
MEAIRMKWFALGVLALVLAGCGDGTIIVFVGPEPVESPQPPASTPTRPDVTPVVRRAQGDHHD